MVEQEKTIWGIHAGKTGDADTLFLKGGYIALGWPQMGDLGALKADRDDFRKKVAKIYPNSKPGAIRTYTGELYRFVHEIKIGDIVAFPSKRDRKIHIGSIEGDYKYDPSKEPAYPNLRPVKWLKAVPRTQFTQGALYEIGSAMSLFQIRTYADEFFTALEGKTEPPPAVQDDTIKIVAEDIEETTSDFILKRLGQELKGHPLTEFVSHLLQAMGYHTRISPEGPDGGIDIIAHKDELGLEQPIIKVQVKSTDSSIGDPTVSAFYGKVGKDVGLFITLGTFTSQARVFSRSISNLRLIDGDELVSLILQYYEQFDSKYKGLLPLKKVYVPESLEGEE
jgi:restriction system protein